MAAVNKEAHIPDDSTEEDAHVSLLQSLLLFTVVSKVTNNWMNNRRVFCHRYPLYVTWISAGLTICTATALTDTLG